MKSPVLEAEVGQRLPERLVATALVAVPRVVRLKELRHDEELVARHDALAD